MIYTLIFSVIGLAMGGLGGAFGGFIIGSIFDSIRNNRRARQAQQKFTEGRQQYYNDPAQFEEQMLTLIAYVAKADNNRLLQSEFDYCKQYFQKTFPHSDLSQMMLKFRDILNADSTSTDCQDACEKIRQYATVHEKIAVLQCLFGFATADGSAHQSEIEAIRRIAGWCGIDSLTFEAVKLMYISSSYGSSDPFGSYGGGYSSGGYSGGGYSGGHSGGYSGSGGYERVSGPSLDDCYKILEVSASATDDEVKKAYRKLALAHHPDRVSALGEDVRKAAEKKFQEINAAKEKIYKARGL
jgi:DnaJ like chaperone protein